MYFDFEDYRPDISPVGRAISWREGLLLSIIVHLAMVIVLLLWPRLFPFDAAAARQRAVALEARRPEEPARFVFVQPRVDLRAPKPPPRAEPSDQDRVARAPERAPTPANPLPFSRGNSPERVEQMDRETARGRGNEPEPQAGQDARSAPNQEKLPESQSAMLIPANRPPQLPEGAPVRGAVPGGLLGDALKNLRQSMQANQFSNPQGGGGAFGPGIQFDTKGVEFGPWLRRFIEQVKRNWEPLIPDAATYMKGHVVVTFNIHKDGTITELAVAAPCPIEGFNNAAFGAMKATNPTFPLPPEYPSDAAFFTVTFYYNEQPPPQ
jgi:TonB family protein